MEGLIFHAHHGCDAEERALGSTFEVDICLETQIHDTALLHDNLSGTIDYRHVYDIVRKEITGTSKNLLESMGNTIATIILDTFETVVGVDVSVAKKKPPIGAICRQVKVKIKKRRH